MKNLKRLRQAGLSGGVPLRAAFWGTDGRSPGTEADGPPVPGTDQVRGTWWRRAVEEKRNRKGSYAISVPRGFLCHLEKANKENNVVGVEFISGERERKKGSSVRKGLRRVRKGWPAHSDRLRQKPLPRRQEAGSSRLSCPLAQLVLCCHPKHT